VWKLLALVSEQLAHDVSRRTYRVDKVAIAPTSALAFVVLTTPCFAEIRHGREFAHDGTSCVEASVELRERVLSVFLAVEFGIHIPREMIS
jgi:hypothetical protein